MAVGTLISLLPVWRLRAAERHLRFQSLLALVLAAGAAALGESEPWPLVALAVLCGVVNLCYGIYRRTLGRAALVAAILVGVVAVIDTARLAAPGAAAGALAVLTLGGILGGLLMGS